MPYLIEAKGLKKRFGNFTAVDGATLSFKAGQRKFER